MLLDDTIVRGTTQEQLVTMLREVGGAAEVHVRITAPPVRWPCFLGIDIPEPDELIAHELDVEGIRERIGADSARVPRCREPGGGHRRGAGQLCLGCFTRDYPIDVQLPLDKFALERPEVDADGDGLPARCRARSRWAEDAADEEEVPA